MFSRDLTVFCTHRVHPIPIPLTEWTRVFSCLFLPIRSWSLFIDPSLVFRKSHSTTLALIEVTDNLLFNLENDNISVGIYTDLQKAFDTVNHKILSTKMYNYGIRGIVHNWFSSYLTVRKQYTVVGNNQSLLGNITCGVPQGSVLGPLLFLLSSSSSSPTKRLSWRLVRKLQGHVTK